jgi:hypothetical protein
VRMAVRPRHSFSHGLRASSRGSPVGSALHAAQKMGFCATQRNHCGRQRSVSPVAEWPVRCAGALTHTDLRPETSETSGRPDGSLRKLPTGSFRPGPEVSGRAEVSARPEVSGRPGRGASGRGAAARATNCGRTDPL